MTNTLGCIGMNVITRKSQNVSKQNSCHPNMYRPTLKMHHIEATTASQNRQTMFMFYVGTSVILILVMTLKCLNDPSTCHRIINTKRKE